MTERPSRLPLYLGVVLAVCGWAAIGVAWYQAGRQELETGQLPFVISGGFGGWGLLLMGAVGIVVDAVRQAAWTLRSATDAQEREFGELRRALDELAGGPADDPPRRRRRRAADG